MKSGITVQCVSCKAKKTLSFEEARALTDMPFCECGMPMVAVSAHSSLARQVVGPVTPKDVARRVPKERGK